MRCLSDWEVLKNLQYNLLPLLTFLFNLSFFEEMVPEFDPGLKESASAHQFSFTLEAKENLSVS